MPSLAKHAHGSSVQVETAEGSGEYVKILGVVDIEGFNVDREEYDSTDQESPDAGEEVVPGIARFGPGNFGLNVFPGNAGQKQLRLDNKTGVQRNYRIVENTGEWSQARCFVKTYNPTRRVRGIRQAQVSLRPVAFPDYSDE